MRPPPLRLQGPQLACLLMTNCTVTAPAVVTLLSCAVAETRRALVRRAAAFRLGTKAVPCPCRDARNGQNAVREPAASCSALMVRGKGSPNARLVSARRCLVTSLSQSWKDYGGSLPIEAPARAATAAQLILNAWPASLCSLSTPSFSIYVYSASD